MDGLAVDVHRKVAFFIPPDIRKSIVLAAYVIKTLSHKLASDVVVFVSEVLDVDVQKSDLASCLVEGLVQCHPSTFGHRTSDDCEFMAGMVESVDVWQRKVLELERYDHDQKAHALPRRSRQISTCRVMWQLHVLTTNTARAKALRPRRKPHFHSRRVLSKADRALAIIMVIAPLRVFVRSSALTHHAF